MRSHAKASSAGSNSGRGASTRSLPRSAPLLAGLCALLLAACLAPSSALAVKTHVYTGTSFGPEGTAGGASFGNVQGVAVDQASGNVFVYANAEGGKIFKFDSAGEPVNFSAKSGNVIEGVGSAPEPGLAEIAVAPAGAPGGSAGDIYVSSFQSDVRVYAASGEFLGTLSPENSCGVAVDPVGHVFIGSIPSTVSEYIPGANPPINADKSGESTTVAPVICNVAADGLGNIYAAQAQLGAAIVKLAGLSDPTGTLIEPGGNSLAVDLSTNNLYVDRGSEVVQYDSSSALISSFGSDRLAGSHGVAVNGSSGSVYASSGAGRVAIFGPLVTLPEVSTQPASAVAPEAATLHGTVSAGDGPEASCEFQYTTQSVFESEGFEGSTGVPCTPPGPFTGSGAEAVSATLGGLTPGTVYRFRIVGGNIEGSSLGKAISFITPGPPILGEEAVESVGTSDATVSAKINPQSAPTTYHVEYGTTSAYGQSSAESAPVGFDTDFSLHTVSVHIGGLTPGTAYHFRFIATNVAGTSEGADATFATYPGASGFAPCPNDQFRTGFGAHLPDCRAYEQATPIDKHGANAQGTVNAVQASSTGDRLTFYLNGGLPDSDGNSTLSAFMASRGPSGWSSTGLLPATEPGVEASVMGWSEDLSTTTVEGPGPGNVGRAIYQRDSGSGAFELALALPGALPSEGGFLAGYAADTSHLIFESKLAIAPGAVAGQQNLYELNHGNLTLAGRIPTGSATSCDDENGPACESAPEGSFAGPYDFQFSSSGSPPGHGGAANLYYTQNTISRDGSRVVFTAAGSGQLYVREDGTKTTRVSASQRTTPDPGGEKPAAFMAASADGSKVFFTSCEKLTDDSTAVSTGEGLCTGFSGPQQDKGQDLYSYDVDSGALTDLSVDSNAGDPVGAAVAGVLGTSEDGAYVYFAAAAAIAPGATPASSYCEPICNLYVSHEGTTTFVARLDGSKSGGNQGDVLDWSPQSFSRSSQSPRTSRVSADGRTLLFSSLGSLTGYDNSSTACKGSGGSNKGPCRELFRYSAPEEELDCVSCDPTGLPPGGNAGLGGDVPFFIHNDPSTTFLTRNLSADGSRVFFESPDALLPSDINGATDVYEWEAKGSGSCKSASQNGGCLYLISGGTSPEDSFFADASTSDDDVFFFTSQQLVPGDGDQLTDVYDASVGGGLPSQHLLAPPTCNSTACQANPAPPPDQTPASAAFSGPGDLHRSAKPRGCPKGKRKVRHAGKARCQKAHKQHKRHTNRGGSK